MIDPPRRTSALPIVVALLTALAAASPAFARLEELVEAAPAPVAPKGAVENDEDEPEQDPANPQVIIGRGRFMMAEENFDQWVFQGRTKDSTREWFDGRMSLHLEDVDRACRLDDAQKAKLKLGGARRHQAVLRAV